MEKLPYLGQELVHASYELAEGKISTDEFQKTYRDCGAVRFSTVLTVIRHMNKDAEAKKRAFNEAVKNGIAVDSSVASELLNEAHKSALAFSYVKGMYNKKNSSFEQVFANVNQQYRQYVRGK